MTIRGKEAKRDTQLRKALANEEGKNSAAAIAANLTPKPKGAATKEEKGPAHSHATESTADIAGRDRPQHPVSAQAIRGAS